MSIGCLLFVLSAETSSGSYSFFKMIIGLIIIVSGIVILFILKNRTKPGDRNGTV